MSRARQVIEDNKALLKQKYDAAKVKGAAVRRCVCMCAVLVRINVRACMCVCLSG